MKYLYAVWCALSLLACSLESFRVLQSASYRPQRGYAKIVISKHFAFLAALTLLSALWKLFVDIEPVLCAVYTLASLFTVLPKRKSPLRYTKRIVRMLVVDFILLLVASYFSLYWWTLFLPLFTLLSWAILLPVELAINSKYLNEAHNKLQSSNMTVIAITGSYGKTSTKDMLAALLSDSLTPVGSCNTPLGIAKFLNSADLSRHKYLILEFGARKRGDIAQLCKLYPPKYGIVTGICPQHMATFKTLYNIVATKRELVEFLPSDGLALLCDQSVHNFAISAPCVALTQPTVALSDITLSPEGLYFSASHGQICANLHLPQITLHSAQTFAWCATLCTQLGQPFTKTVKNAHKIQQTPHRMEISHNGAFYLIDDSYNASPAGIQSCCEALARLNGFKVAICQGVVECGRQNKQLNVQCGTQLGRACNVLIVLGKNAKYLKLGADSTCQTVLTAPNLAQAVQMARPYLSRNSFLLFQNDLPDVANV